MRGLSLFWSLVNVNATEPEPPAINLPPGLIPHSVWRPYYNASDRALLRQIAAGLFPPPHPISTRSRRLWKSEDIARFLRGEWKAKEH